MDDYAVASPSFIVRLPDRTFSNVEKVSEARMNVAEE